MKIKLISVIYLLFSTFLLKSQSFEWARSFGGSGNDSSRSMATDASGNVYTTGFFDNTVDFDPGPGVELRSSNGESDIFIQKLNPNGELDWIRTFGGVSDEAGISMTIHNNGVFVTGFFTETVDFEQGSNLFSLTSQGENDVFILRLDELGNLIWVKSIGGSSTDNVFAMAKSSEGDLYITGSFSGTANLSTEIDSNVNTSIGPEDIFLVKLNSEGSTVWVKTYGGNSGAAAFDIVVDGTGNIFSVGTFGGVSEFDPGTSVFTLSASGFGDIFVQKLDNQGVFQWAKKIGGSGFDQGKSISIDQSGNITIAGIFEDTANFDPADQNLSVSSNGQTDIIIQKLDTSGNLIWNRTFGGIDFDNVQTICNDIDGNLYVTGQFRQTVDFDPSDEIATLNSSQFDDIYILKLTSSGNFSFVKKIEGSGYFEFAGAIEVDVWNNILITGRIDNSFNFGTEDEPEILTSAGSFDVFVAKINQTNSIDIEELEHDSLFIYPNPSNGFLQLKSNYNLGDSDLTIFDASGKLVFQKRILNPISETIYFTNEPGLYLAHLRTKNKLIVKKILVQ